MTKVENLKNVSYGSSGQMFWKKFFHLFNFYYYYYIIL